MTGLLGSSALLGLGGGGGAQSGTLDSGGLPSFDSNGPPPMKTLIYAPAARIIVAHAGRQYDVSSDLLSGGTYRGENTAASVQFSLSNKGLRYTTEKSGCVVFEPMDRVIVFLKRIKWIQVFSGYLDETPFLDMYPATVDFAATCTMKRLMHTLWDPSTDASAVVLQGLNLQTSLAGDGTSDGSSGPSIGALLRNVLEQVGGWDHQEIHIQNFPMSFWNLIENWLQADLAHTQEQVQTFRAQLLGENDTSGGVGDFAGYNAAGGSTGSADYATGSTNYVQTMILCADALGMGPNTADITQAQNLIEAATQAQGSLSGGTDPGWKAVSGYASNWQIASRNKDAAILALACSMAETAPGPRVLSNASVPDSANFPNEGETTSTGSGVGLYNEPASWGLTSQRMDPISATRMWLTALSKLDWPNMDPGTAIQSVQNSSGAAFYAPFIVPATQLVQAARSASEGASAAVGANPLGSLTSLTGLNPATAASELPGVPGVTTTSPSGNVGVGGAGTSGPDTMQAIAYTVAAVGTPYSQSNPQVIGSGLDCSGLVTNAYKSMGINIGRTTYDIARNCQRVPAASIQPGDMIEPESGHVVMYIGNNMIAESSTWGERVAIKPNYINLNSASGIYRPAGVTFGGWDPKVTFDPSTLLNSPGSPPGVTGSGGASSGVAAGGSSEPIARNLFTYQFDYSTFAPKINALFDGERSYINCEPLMNIVQMLAKSSLRNWASAPNGDFVAYYPDYWGLDGKVAVLHLADIEMKNVHITRNDNALATHVYVAGDLTAMGNSVGVEGWLQCGVATVENEALFQRMIQVTPGKAPATNHDDLLRRYGVRPYMQTYNMVANESLQYVLAVQLFMEQWCAMYNTSVDVCFLPELFPGMRISLDGHGIQVYVTSVTHTFDYSSGFATHCTITAPSNPNVALLAGNVGTELGSDTGDPNDMKYFW